MYAVLHDVYGEALAFMRMPVSTPQCVVKKMVRSCDEAGGTRRGARVGRALTMSRGYHEGSERRREALDRE